MTADDVKAEFNLDRLEVDENGVMIATKGKLSAASWLRLVSKVDILQSVSATEKMEQVIQEVYGDDN
mgnify:CR=1 FL=1